MWWRKKRHEEPVYNEDFIEQYRNVEKSFDELRELIQPNEEIESQIARVRELIEQHSDREDIIQLSIYFEECVAYYRSQIEEKRKIVEEGMPEF